MGDHVLISGWRFRALLGIGVLAAAGYLLASLLSGWPATLQALRQVGVPGMTIALGLALLNQLLRFARWNLYLRRLGARVPAWTHWRIYCAGFAFAITPGNAGEAIRAVFLKRHDVEFSHSLAAILSERVSDLLALLLLAALGLGLVRQAHPWLLPVALLALLTLTLLARADWLRQQVKQAARGEGRVGRLLHHLLHLLRQARRCHTPRLLLLALLLGLCAWGADALALWSIAHRLGLGLSLRLAGCAYALAILAGASTVVPGGLGGAEAALAGMLLLSGAAMPQAVAATLLIRLATLWFGVGVGTACLASLRQTP
jgi:uncharacterized protein (TIRG00374 family)